jgi:hypothetical protein
LFNHRKAQYPATAEHIAVIVGTGAKGPVSRFEGYNKGPQSRVTPNKNVFKFIMPLLYPSLHRPVLSEK